MATTKEVLVDGAKAQVPVDDEENAVQAILAFTQFHHAEAPLPSNAAEAAAALAARKTKKPFYTVTQVDRSTYKVVLIDESTGKETASGIVSTEDDATTDQGHGAPAEKASAAAVGAGAAAATAKTGKDTAVEDVTDANGHAADSELKSRAPQVESKIEDSPAAKKSAAELQKTAKDAPSEEGVIASADAANGDKAEPVNALIKDKSEPEGVRETVPEAAQAGKNKEKPKEVKEPKKASAAPVANESTATPVAAAAVKDIPVAKPVAKKDGPKATPAPVKKEASKLAAAHAKKEAPKSTPPKSASKKEKNGFLGRFKRGKGSSKPAKPSGPANPENDPIPQGPRNAVFIPETRYQPNPLAPSREAERARMPVTPLSAEEKAARAAKKQKEEEEKRAQLQKEAEAREAAKKAKEEQAGAKEEAKAQEDVSKSNEEPSQAKAEENVSKVKEEPVQAKTGEDVPKSKEEPIQEPSTAKAVPTKTEEEPADVAKVAANPTAANPTAENAADARSDDTWSSNFEPEPTADGPTAPFAAPVGAFGRFVAVDDQNEPKAAAKGTQAELAEREVAGDAPNAVAIDSEAASAEPALFAPAVAPIGAHFAAVDEAAAAPAKKADEASKTKLEHSIEAPLSRNSLESAREVESLAAGATAAGAAPTATATKAAEPPKPVLQPSEAEKAKGEEEKGRFNWFRRSKSSPKEKAAEPAKEAKEVKASDTAPVAFDETHVGEASASEDEVANKKHAGADALADGVGLTEPESDADQVAESRPLNTSRLREILSSGGTDGVAEEDRAALRADKSANKRLTGLQKQASAEEKQREKEEKKRAQDAAKSTSGQRSALEDEGEAARTNAASEAKRLADIRKAAAKQAAKEQKAKIAAEKKQRMEASKAVKLKRKQTEAQAQEQARAELAAWQDRQKTLARDRLAAVKAQRAVLDEQFTPERAAEAATNPAEHYNVWREEHPLVLNKQGREHRSRSVAPRVEDGERVPVRRTVQTRVVKANPDAPLSRKYATPKETDASTPSKVKIATPKGSRSVPSVRSEITVVNPSRGRGIPVPAIQWTNGGSW